MVHGAEYIDKISTRLSLIFKQNLKKLNTINGLKDKNKFIKDSEIFTTNMTYMHEQTNKNKYLNYHTVIEIIIFCYIIIYREFVYLTKGIKI